MFLNTCFWLSLFLFGASWGLAPRASVHSGGGAGQWYCNLALGCWVAIVVLGSFISMSWWKPTGPGDQRARVPLFRFMIGVWTMLALAGVAYAFTVAKGHPPKDGSLRGSDGAPLAAGAQLVLTFIFCHLGVGRMMTEGTLTPDPNRKREPAEEQNV